MMSAYESMRKVLEGTGLYSCKENPPLDAELRSYGAAFADIEEKLERLLKNIFIDTAEESVINAKELLCRPQISSASLEKRKEMLIMRYSLFPNDNTAAMLEKNFLSTACKGRISSDGINKIIVHIEETYGVSNEEIERELDAYLPAHLEHEIIYE